MRAMHTRKPMASQLQMLLSGQAQDGRVVRITYTQLLARALHRTMSWILLFNTLTTPQFFPT